MPKHPRTTQLIELMSAHRVNSVVVGELLDRAPKTVRCWRAQSPRPINAAMLELLRFKLGTLVKGAK